MMPEAARARPWRGRAAGSYFFKKVASAPAFTFSGPVVDTTTVRPAPTLAFTCSPRASARRAHSTSLLRIALRLILARALWSVSLHNDQGLLPIVDGFHAVVAAALEDELHLTRLALAGLEHDRATGP